MKPTFQETRDSSVVFGFCPCWPGFPSTSVPGEEKATTAARAERSRKLVTLGATRIAT